MRKFPGVAKPLKDPKPVIEELIDVEPAIVALPKAVSTPEIGKERCDAPFCSM